MDHEDANYFGYPRDMFVRSRRSKLLKISCSGPSSEDVYEEVFEAGPVRDLLLHRRLPGL